MCKHKPKCLFRGLQCSVTHDFQALYGHLLSPKAVLLFLHSVWAFPPYFTTSWPVGLWNIVSICHTSVPRSISSKTITKSHQLPLWGKLCRGAAKDSPAQTKQVSGAVSITEDLNYINHAFVRDHLIPQIFPLLWVESNMWVMGCAYRYSVGLGHCSCHKEEGSAVPKSPAAFQMRHLQRGLWFFILFPELRPDDDCIPFHLNNWFMNFLFHNECTDQECLRPC